MKSVLIAIVVCAAVGIVLSTHCGHGGDASNCNINCTVGVVGCEHEICTCVPETVTCMTSADCTIDCNKHGESAHCLDSVCRCIKVR